jgi:hypothetical protein
MNLSNVDLHILDIIINLGPFKKYDDFIYEFYLNKEDHLTRKEIDVAIQKFLNSGLISIVKNRYDEELIMANTEAEKILANYWKEKIKKEKLLEIAQENYQELLKLLELKIKDSSRNISYIRFIFGSYSDNYDQSLAGFCEKLLEANMVFKASGISSTGKTITEDYYLRKVPIDVERELQNYVLNSINTEDFRVDLEWLALLLPMLIKSNIKIADIEAIFPSLTRIEVLDLLKRLEDKKILKIYNEEISIPESIRTNIKQKFIWRYYADFESFMIRQLRKRIAESMSSLYLLGTIKSLLVSGKATDDGPFAIIERSSAVNEILKNVEKDIPKLGIVFLAKDHIVIAKRVLDELESILKSKIFEKVIRVPANDTYTAINAWRKILGEECKDYIKIQDEYVNEETLEILRSYTPPQISITILTSIEGAKDADIEAMKRIVNKIRDSGRKLEWYSIGDSLGKAPFHFRYIISRDICYSISTSIKQVGKSKDADLILISKEEKEGLIEPAFDYWIGVPKDKLKEKGLHRMNFEEWLKYKSSQ